MSLAAAKRYVQTRLHSQHHHELAFVAFKLACSVSLGTLMSLTPGYAGIWSTPFSLADQVIFTILGGVNLTVGGVTEQFLWRFVVSAVCGAGCYSLVQVLGGNPEAQGVVFFILVFLWGYIRVKLPKTDIAVTFVILACVYAVDNSYRFGQRYAVNTDALSDLLKSWAFGAAISVAVNLLVLPVKASGLARIRTVDTLRSIRSIAGWMLNDANHPDISYTPAQVRQILHTDGDRLAQMQDELAWELGWSASTLDERKHLTSAVLALQNSLIVSSRDGAFVVDLPADLVRILQPAVAVFSKYALDSIDGILATLENKKRDIEATTSPTSFVQARVLFDRASAQVTDLVITALRTPKPDPARLASLDRATHCLDATITLADAIVDLEQLVTRDSQRSKRLQPYLFQTLSRNARDLLPRSSQPIALDTKAAPSSALSVVPSLRFRRQAIAFITSFEMRYALKIAGAMSCLQAIQWAPATRGFFLAYNVRNATVPLLLALMPNLGLSVFSWLGQLSGACVGTMYAALIMLIFRGVGSMGFSLPGIFFFQFFLGLAVGHRMLNGPDFFAVTAQNACAIFIVIEFYSGQALGLRLGYMLVTCCIAIALAIPFQLLLFPNHARDGMRQGIARILRRLSTLAIDEISLSSAVLFSDDEAHIKAETERLMGEVKEIKAALREQDGLVFFAAKEWGNMDGFQATRARAIIEALHRCVDTMSAHIGLCQGGAVDPRIRRLIGHDNENIAGAFGEACSNVFWVLGASWTLLEAPPASLPSVQLAAERLLGVLGQPEHSTADREWMTGDIEAKRDVRKWWSLTLTLVQQRTDIAALAHVMGPDWKQPAKTPVRPAAPERLMSEELKGDFEVKPTDLLPTLR